ncbi:hypothetical protein CTheo_8088 [Ceratobasidium theobromae]|uniref:Intradiol ring-cleavage dioxygenases domain-containing protein n=1 Tax=Ceratobasidium theobromae TaxID=1582974 RepID=A0A5N5Q9Y6_9AGAM|nr:hypothetical protein CTheo_8088 [Ceratobasidium theobromae]
MFTKTFAVAGLFAASLQLATAHPGEIHVPLPRAELQRRQLEATRRHNVARNCAPQIAEFNAKRKAKRNALASRKQFNGGRFAPRQDDTAATNTPTFPNIQNSTCVTAPEVTEGPYYVANELLRTDLREEQAGVDLILDIGVMDTTTCTPLSDALVEVWACNATGSYSGFTTAVLQIPDGSGPMQSTSMTDQFTWLRGGYATNSEGVVEFKTIYPGYYSGRTIHIHTMVHTNYNVATNGSIISHAGQVRHIGQIFFDEDLNDQVLAQSAYLNTTQTRTLNDEDSILAEENSNGYNAFAAAQLLGDDVSDGVLAYITMGVDTSFEGSITTTNYVTAAADSQSTPSAAA